MTSAGAVSAAHSPADGLRSWLVVRRPDGGCTGGVAPLPEAAEDAGVAAIRVEAAGFNYKDALACSGHPGVMRIASLVPGIDAAGTLVEAAAGLPAGAAVVATGNGLGETRHGGFADVVRAPLAAILPRPPSLSAREAMALGTAGLTALLACDRLAGIDAATQATPDDRRALWPRLAAFWPRVRDHFPVTELGLDEVGGWAERMLRGETSGRAVVVP